jgi:hypothetical protein
MPLELQLTSECNLLRIIEWELYPRDEASVLVYFGGFPCRCGSDTCRLESDPLTTRSRMSLQVPQVTDQAPAPCKPPLHAATPRSVLKVSSSCSFINFVPHSRSMTVERDPAQMWLALRYRASQLLASPVSRFRSRKPAETEKEEGRRIRRASRTCRE